jgi:hypothetical protein
VVGRANGVITEDLRPRADQCGGVRQVRKVLVEERSHYLDVEQARQL